jgi:hypothetical protein
MIAQFLSLVIANTYSWLGGQGYCAYDFALHETESEYSQVEIVLRPKFDPANTASGNTTLPDETISLAHIGGAHVDWDQSAKIETDCNVTGFDIVRARAVEDGQKVDLIRQDRISIETYKPLALTVKGREQPE